MTPRGIGGDQRADSSRHHLGPLDAHTPGTEWGTRGPATVLPWTPGPSERPTRKDSDNDGKRIPIRCQDNTAWDQARGHAIRSWNAVGAITIAPDDASIVADLDWLNVNRSDVAGDDLWNPLAGADEPYFNSPSLGGWRAWLMRCSLAG